MSRLLLAFGLVEGLAVAAFLWSPLASAKREPAELLPWAATAAGCFYLLAWPALERRREGEPDPGPLPEAAGVATRAGLLLLAFAPVVSASLALAPAPLAKSLFPLLVAWAAGGLLAWSARAGGPELARAAVAAGLAAVAVGPIGRMLAGAAGTTPGPAFDVFTKPWIALLALLFPAAALLARRLKAGAA